MKTDGKTLYKDMFHKRLKKAREDMGYTQEQVCEMLSITQTALSRYENGHREPNIEILGQMAEIYNMSIDWLYGLGKQNNAEQIKQEKYLNDLEKSIKKEVRQDKKKIAT